MGTQAVEARTDEIQESKPTLKIISFSGKNLPDNYHSVVIARWLNSLKRLNKLFKAIDNEAYYKHYEEFIKAILKRPNVVVNLAALSEDPDVIFGWSVFDCISHSLHYVHVQEPYRRQGISYDLIPDNIMWITHTTRHWEEYLGSKEKRFHKVKFNPFLY